ncbi:MAG: LytR/AlgR family response regulator transcription factor, partial [Planctomycetaceae bacterium]
SGFSIPSALDNPPHIIFVTAFDQYAVRAFEANAVDYLLKPVSAARLTEAIQRVRQRAPLVTSPTRRLQADDMALIPLGNSGFFTQVRDILVIEAQNHHSRVTLDSGRICLVRKQLREWV